MAHGRLVGEDDLHAHIDGQPPLERTEEVTAYLAAHPEVEAWFSQYAAQRQALREALSAQADGGGTGPSAATSPCPISVQPAFG